MGNLFLELRRRKVVPVAATYALTAWLVIQIAVAVERPLHLPDWVDTLVIVLLGVGFPIALILSWAFDFTEKGIQLAEAPDTATKPASSSAPSLMVGMQILVLLAVGFLIFDQYLSNENPLPSNPDTAAQDTRAITTRFVHPLGPGFLQNVIVTSGFLAVSPSGDRIVFRAVDGLHIREMGSLSTRLLLATGQPAQSPVFSPDGGAVAYWDQGSNEIRRIAVTGGAPVAITTDVTMPFGISWAGDGFIYFGQSDGIYRVGVDGEEAAQRVVTGGMEMQVFGPQLLPDGQTLLYSQSRLGEWDSGQVIAHSLTTGEEHLVLEGGNRARYLAAGYLVYVLGDRLYGMPFDMASLSVTGQSVLLVDEVARSDFAWQAGSAHFDVSENGTLVYLKQTRNVPNAIVWVDRTGSETPVAIESRAYGNIDLSPDGSQLLLSVNNAGVEIWVWDFQRETQTRLNLGKFGGDNPAWTPDGRSVAYHPSTGEIIDWRASNNVGEVQTLASGSDLNFGAWHPESFSPSGTELVFHGQARPGTGWDLGLIRLGDTIEMSWIIDDPFDQRGAVISPDGRWLAYMSAESGRFEILVRPFPNVDDGRWLVSKRGGAQPRWSDDGRTLYFLEPGSPSMLMSTDVTVAGGDLIFSDLDTLLEWPYRQSYDIAADEQRFIAAKPLGVEDTSGEIVVVQNWFEEVNRLVNQ